jgi:threonine/homoserine/homoserine lactone efflux protein
VLTPALLLSWTGLALIAGMSPGPDTLVVAGHSAHGGLRAGLAAVAGIVTGGLWYMALIGLGLLTLLAAWPALFVAAKIVGAGYLAYLGLRLLRSALDPTPATSDAPLALGRPFRQAFFTNALNPKVALFYLAALPQFVGVGPDAPYVGVLLIAIHYLVSGAWLACLAFAAARAGRVLRSSGTMRWIEGVLGAAVIGLAGKLAVSRS